MRRYLTYLDIKLFILFNRLTRYPDIPYHVLAQNSPHSGSKKLTKKRRRKKH